MRSVFLVLLILASMFKPLLASENRFESRPHLVEDFIAKLSGPSARERDKILHLFDNKQIKDSELSTYMGILETALDRLESTQTKLDYGKFCELYNGWLESRESFLEVLKVDFEKNSRQVDRAYSQLERDAKRLFAFMGRNHGERINDYRTESTKLIKVLLQKMNVDISERTLSPAQAAIEVLTSHLKSHERVKRTNDAFLFSSHKKLGLYDRSPRNKDDSIEFAEILNLHRLNAGLSALQLEESLIRASNQHNFEMAEESYFSHVAPEEVDNPEFSTPAKRATMFQFKGEYRSENIFRASAGSSAIQAFRAWWVSDGHRFNMFSWSDTQANYYYANSLGVAYSAKHWTMMTGNLQSQITGESRELRFQKLR